MFTKRLNKLRKIFFVIVLLFGLTGCDPARRFALREMEAPDLNGLSSLHGRAVVENGGSRDLMLESANVVVSYRGRELSSARLLLPVEIPAGVTTAIRYDFALDGLSLSSLQTMQSRILTNAGAFTVDVKGYVRWGRIRKKIDLKGVPLTGVMGIIANFTP